MPDAKKKGIARTRQEHNFLEEVSELRYKLHGHSVLTYGSSWTAEVREPDRKRRLHGQLELARKLRLSMENAADKAEKVSDDDARIAILEEHTPNISSLVSLTLAVQGGYTLDDYKHFIRSLQDQERKDKSEAYDVYNSIMSHLSAMADERDGVSREPSKSKRIRSSVVYEHPTRRTSIEFRSSSSSSESVDSNTKKPKISLDKTDDLNLHFSDEDYEPEHNALPLLQDRKRGSRKEQQGSRAPARPSRRRNVSTRRCHDCKSSTTYFRRCHYWFLTGTKCGKVFCSKCLQVKYGAAQLDWDNIKNDSDWHCPSCLGNCICADCVRDRKRAMRKDTSSYQTRRSFSASTPLMETSL